MAFKEKIVHLQVSRYHKDIYLKPKNKIMTKQIFHSITFLLALLFLAACSESDDLQSVNNERTSDLSKYKIIVNATLGKASRMVPETGAWQDGDKIYIALDNDESNAWTLTYSAADKQFAITAIGSSSGFAASGSVAGLYTSNGNLTASNGKVTGTTTGDVVYTKSGTYTKSDNTITITLRLDQRKASLLKITGCEGECYIENMKTNYNTLTSLKDMTWDETSTTPSYIYDATNKTAYCYGTLPTDGIVVLRNKGGYKYTRNTAVTTLAAGEMTTIQGPGTAPTDWTKDNTEYFADGSVITYNTATTSKAFTLVVVPEGYQLGAMKQSGGQFYTDAKAAMDYLFSVEPFNNLKKYFNVYIITAISTDAGADIYSNNTGTTISTSRNTYFNVGWGPGNNSYAKMGSQDESAVYSFVSKYCPDLNGKGSYSGNINNTAVLMLVNDSRYGAICSFESTGKSVSYVSLYSYAGLSWGSGACKGNWKNLVAHEFGGHGIGRLGDEYHTTTGSYPNSLSLLSMQTLYSVPFALNLTTNESSYGWSWMKAKGYTGEGLYEGGDGYTQGIWRPEETSCMVYNMPYYNAYSRYLIIKRIYDACGTSYSQDIFYNMDSKASSYTSGAKASLESPHTTDVYEVPAPTFHDYRLSK